MNKLRLLLAFALTVSTMSSTAKAEMILDSFDIENGKKLEDTQVFNGYGCFGYNISPSLEWNGEPQGTKSFAITLFDPDAQDGKGWWHWALYNIPATIHALERDAGNVDNSKIPAGSTQGQTDFGRPGFGGACPPRDDGQHHYQLALYALDVEELKLSNDATPEMIHTEIQSHTLESTGIEAVYSR